MFALIQWTKQKQRRDVVIRDKEILRLRLWEVLLVRKEKTPAFLLRRRCGAAAKQLQKLGVTRAVFPERFLFLEEFARYGIRPADPLPLYRALTGELVQAALEERGQSGQGAVVAVCADHLAAEIRQAVTTLCIRNRYVILNAPDRNGDFCRQMRREYGAPLVQTEDFQQLSRASVLVLFSPRPGAFPGQTVLELYQDGTLPAFRLVLGPEEEQLLPRDCERSQLLGALWTAGAVRPGQLAVLPEREE